MVEISTWKTCGNFYYSIYLMFMNRINLVDKE